MHAGHTRAAVALARIWAGSAHQRLWHPFHNAHAFCSISNFAHALMHAGHVRAAIALARISPSKALASSVQHVCILAYFCACSHAYRASEGGHRFGQDQPRRGYGIP
eukprot:1160924-Pelagomonas_calceolata.AAC.1